MPKNALILSSFGGGGHESARMQIEDFLQDNGWTSSVFYPIDQTRVIGIPSTEKIIYNPLLKRECFTLIEILRFVGIVYFRAQTHQIEKSLLKVLKGKKPQLIISVCPLITSALVRAAEKTSTPLLIAPVDLDLSHYDLPQRIQSASVRIFAPDGVRCDHLKQHVTITGFPLRKSFLVPSQLDRQQLKAQLGLPAEKTILLLMMGAVGTEKLYNLTKILVQSNVLKNIHLVIFCGRNQSMINKIQREIQPLNNCSFTCLGFTQKVAQYMQAATVLVTKPGPFTTAEATSTKCFMALEARKPLSWEKANIENVLTKKIGFAFRSNSELLTQLSQYLAHPKAYPENLCPNTFYPETKNLLNEIEQSSSSYQVFEAVSSTQKHSIFSKSYAITMLALTALHIFTAPYIYQETDL